MTKIEKMDLPAGAAFIRQTATNQELEDDEKNGQYISPFSRKRKWQKQQSDKFFQRIKLILQKNDTPLDNVYFKFVNNFFNSNI